MQREDDIHMQAELYIQAQTEPRANHSEYKYVFLLTSLTAAHEADTVHMRLIRKISESSNQVHASSKQGSSELQMTPITQCKPAAEMQTAEDTAAMKQSIRPES